MSLDERTYSSPILPVPLKEKGSEGQLRSQRKGTNRSALLGLAPFGGRLEASARRDGALFQCCPMFLHPFVWQ